MNLFLELDEVPKLVCTYLNDTYRSAYLKVAELPPTEWKPIFDKCAADIVDNLGQTVGIDTYSELDIYYFKMHTSHFDNITIDGIYWRAPYSNPAIGNTTAILDHQVSFMGIMTFSTTPINPPP